MRDGTADLADLLAAIRERVGERVTVAYERVDAIGTTATGRNDRPREDIVVSSVTIEEG